MIYHNLSNYLPNNPEKHPIDYTLCFSTAAAAAPPSASHPRRPRPDGAAITGGSAKGHAAVVEQLISAGATVDAADNRRPWPRKGFRVVSGVALARWRKGFVHWQVIFSCALGYFGMLSGARTCCLRIHFLCWDGPLEIRVKRNEMKRVESRRNHVVSKCSLDLFFDDFELDPTFVFEIVIAVWNNFWQQSCQIFSLPAVECIVILFLLQACILRLKRKRKMENTWDPSKNSCEALIVPNLTRPNIENSAWQMQCVPWAWAPGSIPLDI